MSKKKEDNRDIFDKALDYAEPAAGAAVGAAAGAYLGRGRARKYVRDAKKAWKEHSGPMSKKGIKETKDFAYQGRNRGIETGALGAAAGGVSGEAYRQNKRRK